MVSGSQLSESPPRRLSVNVRESLVAEYEAVIYDAKTPLLEAQTVVRWSDRSREDVKARSDSSAPLPAPVASVVSGRQKVIVFVLALGNFCVGASVSLQAPFFPREVGGTLSAPKGKVQICVGVYFVRLVHMSQTAIGDRTDTVC